MDAFWAVAGLKAEATSGLRVVLCLNSVLFSTGAPALARLTGHRRLTPAFLPFAGTWPHCCGSECSKASIFLGDISVPLLVFLPLGYFVPRIPSSPTSTQLPHPTSLFTLTLIHYEA